MLNTFKALAAVLVAAALAGCAGTQTQEETSEIQSKAVAVVNGEAIKYGEFKQELDTTYQGFHQSGQLIDGTQYEQLKVEVRESLINLIVLDQYSRKLSITVDEAQLDQYFQKAVDQYPSKRAYRNSLKEAGLTESDLRARLRRSLAAKQVVDTQVAPGIKVTQEELKTYYDAHAYEFEHDVQVRAAHILIKVPTFADRETRAKAKQRIIEIQNKIKSGGDFAALAKEFSEGPSKVNGGDLGYFGSAQMAPAFETAAFSLEPGEVSDVVTTQFGFHLIKMYDRKPAGKESFSEAAPKLKARFYKERLNTSLRKIVEKLKAEAQIERLPFE